jgi:hypothetical protein
MAFDDLPLDRSGQPLPPLPQRRPQGSPTRWVIVGALLVVVGSVLALWWMSRTELQTATPAPTTATDVVAGSNRPKRQPIELPALDSSDSWLREMVAALSAHPLLTRLLITPELVRSAVLVVEQIGEGRTPAQPLKVLRPTSRLTILGPESGRVDPASYTRWDAATASLTSINPADAAQLYVNAKPIFDQAYRDLGHPNGDFDDSIVRAINVLSATPVVVSDPELLKRPSYFEHTDPALRSLQPVQKELLLIGPVNRQRVMSWLKRVAAALELKIS